MKDILFQWFRSFFFVQIEQMKRRLRYETELNYINETNEARIKTEMQQQLNLIGKRVVCFSNENEQPLVGKIIHFELCSQAGDRVPVIVDENTNKQTVIFGKVFEATPEVLEFVERLEPKHWCSILYNMKQFQKNW
jgi:hypothetical protein